jgi:hypothetical protein
VTEEEWLNSTYPAPMFQLRRGFMSTRKLRLFGVGCCRRKWDYFGDERFRQVVEVVEEYADDPDRIGAFDFARQNAGTALASWRRRKAPRVEVALRVGEAVTNLTFTPPNLLHIASTVAGVPVNSTRAKLAEGGHQAQLLRDIFGNPFRPVTLDPRWQTELVVALANGIYVDRAFDRMPILADALEDAGCDIPPDVLSHCRGDGPHVRGCWVVDLVLGKS